MEWYALALISAFFSAIAAIFEKKILFKEKALEFTAVLAVFNLALCIPFFFLTDFSRISAAAISALLFKSVLNALAFLCVMAGVKKLELSNALPLLVLTPGLVAISAFFFLGEALTAKEIAGCILLIIGTYALEVKTKQKIFDPFRVFIKSKGHYYIILALVLFTITSVLDKFVLKNLNLQPNAFMAFQHLFFALIYFVFVFFMGKLKEIKIPLKRSWKLILALAVLTIIYRYTQITATKIAYSVAMVIAIKRISVFFAIVIGGKLFKEHALLRRIIASAIMITGAVLVIFGGTPA